MMMIFQRLMLAFMALAIVIGAPHPARAQITSVDPNSALGTPAKPSPSQTTPPPRTTPPPPPVASDDPNADLAPPIGTAGDGTTPETTAPGAAGTGFPAPAEATPATDTYKKDDLIGAAEGVFGKGAEGLARIIEDVLKDQGQPNGYIVGREASAALVIGLRYGSGKLMHKVEGEQPAYWTGPSIGIDAGANAAKTFVLVYNLYDTDDLYKRFPAGEGNAYFVGGFTASYLRRGDVVLIPIRLGVGVRLGANIGYMKFSKSQKWLPF